MDLLSFANENIELIWADPLSYFIFGALAFGLGFAVSDRLSARAHEIKDQRLAAYQEKLDGASPDEAAARIAALEHQVTTLAPPSLSEERRAALLAAASRHKGVITITRDSAHSRNAFIHRQIIECFKEAGWDVGITSIAEIEQPEFARLVSRHDFNQSDVSTVRDALKAANLPFDEQDWSSSTETTLRSPAIWLSGTLPA